MGLHGQRCPSGPWKPSSREARGSGGLSGLWERVRAPPGDLDAGLQERALEQL